MDERKKASFQDLTAIVERLRRECPWDSVQTFESLQKCLAEETKEVEEGVKLLHDTKDAENLCEELGDLLFLILLHGAIAKEQDLFTMEDVIDRISSKMQFRHPKIFSPENTERASMSWEELKQREHDVQNGENP